MKWIPQSYYHKKRQEAWREQIKTWHRHFALRPTFIREITVDGFVTPAHYVWLEQVDRKLVEENWYRDIPFWIWIGNFLTLFAPSIKWSYRPATTDTKPIELPTIKRLTLLTE